MVKSVDARDAACRAKHIDVDRLREPLKRNHLNCYVAIEPFSGDFFLGGAIDAAEMVHRDRATYAIRIGPGAAVEIGRSM